MVITHSVSFGAHWFRLLQLIPGSLGVEVAPASRIRASARRLGGKKDHIYLQVLVKLSL